MKEKRHRCAWPECPKGSRRVESEMTLLYDQKLITGKTGVWTCKGECTRRMSLRLQVDEGRGAFKLVAKVG